MVGFGFILALAGIIIFIIGVAQAAQNHAFRNAQRVKGTVIRKHNRNTKAGHEYLLNLAYSVDGISYEREVGVLATEYDAIALGDKYEVQYRPDKPKRILRPQDTDPKTVKVFLILGAVLLVVGAAMLFSIRIANM